MNHPQIPGLVDAFTFNGVHYIVQDYIEGLPLSYYIRNGYRFNEVEVKGIIIQLLSILNYLHCPPVRENAVVHRDLRLSNLLFSDGRIYLIDFGFARYLDPARYDFVPDPVTGSCSGSYYNMSGRDSNPDSGRTSGSEAYHLLRKSISAGSDLFGVGVVGVDLFTNIVEDQALFKRPWQEVLPLSKPFACFLNKLLSRENRFETASEAMAHSGLKMI